MSQLSREQLLDTVEQTDSQVQPDSLQRSCAREAIKHHDAAQRAQLRQREEEVAELTGAVEVIQSSRDILLNTFCLWAKDYQEGKMALREVADLRAQLAARTQQRDAAKACWKEKP